MPLDEEDYRETLMRVKEIDNDLTELRARGACAYRTRSHVEPGIVTMIAQE